MARHRCHADAVVARSRVCGRALRVCAAIRAHMHRPARQLASYSHVSDACIYMGEFVCAACTYAYDRELFIKPTVNLSMIE